MKNFGEKIPLGWINFITVISGIATVISTIISLLLAVSSNNAETPSPILPYYIISIICIGLFCIVLYLRMRKYQKISVERLSTSQQYHKLAHDTRDLYYETLHAYRLQQLSIETLSNLYVSKLTCILNLLCDILKKHTTKDICACIKLIQYNDSQDTLDMGTAKLETFCRSGNSSTNRGEYEKTLEIKLSDNTDYLEIIDGTSEKNYFYQSSLSAYDKLLQEQGRSYKNTNINWKRYYEGVIIVPIRIETKKLYHIKRDNSYHIIGFLCVDSESKDAFPTKHETYYAEIVKAFGDVIYILLSQYKYYLNKLKKKTMSGGRP